MEVSAFARVGAHDCRSLSEIAQFFTKPFLHKKCVSEGGLFDAWPCKLGADTAVLREIKSSADPGRTWFSDLELDLFVWRDDDDNITRFELSYDKSQLEKSFTWDAKTGYDHNAIDNGDRSGKYPVAPLHASSERFDAVHVAQAFSARASDIDVDIANFVLRALSEASAGSPARPSIPKPEIRFLTPRLLVAVAIVAALIWFAVAQRL